MLAHGHVQPKYPGSNLPIHRDSAPYIESGAVFACLLADGGLLGADAQYSCKCILWSGMSIPTGCWDLKLCFLSHHI